MRTSSQHISSSGGCKVVSRGVLDRERILQVRPLPAALREPLFARQIHNSVARRCA
jgi:hypothetical protein